MAEQWPTFNGKNKRCGLLAKRNKRIPPNNGIVWQITKIGVECCVVCGRVNGAGSTPSRRENLRIWHAGVWRYSRSKQLVTAQRQNSGCIDEGVQWYTYHQYGVGFGAIKWIDTHDINERVRLTYNGCSHPAGDMATQPANNGHEGTVVHEYANNQTAYRTNVG